jgi:hypothetical protein
LSGSGDPVETEVELAELRALADRIDRQELEPGELPLLRTLVCEFLAEEFAEDAETASEANGPNCAATSTSECGSKHGPFGVLAWWMASR